MKNAPKIKKADRGFGNFDWTIILADGTRISGFPTKKAAQAAAQNG